jgi:hypothetical protein
VFGSNIPLHTNILIQYDILTNELRDISIDPNETQSLRVAASKGLDVLNKYNGRNDSNSEMYHIAMSMAFYKSKSRLTDIMYLVLHPSMKLDYFWKSGFPEEWIRMATTVTERCWEKFYRTTGVDRSVDASATMNIQSSHHDIRLSVCIYDFISLC